MRRVVEVVEENEQIVFVPGPTFEQIDNAAWKLIAAGEKRTGREIEAVGKVRCPVTERRRLIGQRRQQLVYGLGVGVYESWCQNGQHEQQRHG